MMPHYWRCWVLVLVIVTTGCLGTASTIPNGVYTRMDGGDYLQISDDEIRFFIADGARPREVVGKTSYTFGFQRDGRLHVIIRSAERDDLVGRVYFFWNGSDFAMYDPSTGVTSSFSRLQGGESP